jgi:2'-5' RNA ligase
MREKSYEPSEPPRRTPSTADRYGPAGHGAAERLRLGRQALADPALRQVSESSRHMPLLFIGQRPQREVVRYLAAIRKACTGLTSPWVEFQDPQPRPARGRPKSFALPAVSPGTDVLHVLLCATLDACGLRFHAPENRPFRPHLTVARVRTEAASRRPMQVSVAPKGPLPQALREPWGVASVGCTSRKCCPRPSATFCSARSICRHSLTGAT